MLTKQMKKRLTESLSQRAEKKRQDHTNSARGRVFNHYQNPVKLKYKKDDSQSQCLKALSEVLQNYSQSAGGSTD